MGMLWLFFFFQAEGGIRDYDVTGVQTCALPIYEGISSPVGISITQDGRYLFVSSEIPDGRYQPRFSFEGELAPGTVVVIDTETLDVIKIIEVGQGSAATGSRVVLPPPVG